MNKPVLITAGIVIILSMIGIWGYLLAYGTPKETADVFANLGVFGTEEDTVRVLDIQNQPVTTVEDAVTLSLAGGPLQQLTTRAVAGFTFASSTLIRYVERGTGYVYEIDLSVGTETQIAPMTIPQAFSAVFSPTGETVAITAQYATSSETLIIYANDPRLEKEIYTLPTNSGQIAYRDEESVYYSVKQGSNTSGYLFDIESQTATLLFTTPIRDAKVIWGNEVSGIYVQAKPSASLHSALYKVANGVLVPITEEEPGLIATVRNTNVYKSYIEDDVYTSAVVENGEETLQSALLLEEKCALSQIQTSVWCARPLVLPEASYLEAWYMGTIISSDMLWKANLVTGDAVLVADLQELARRSIDVVGPIENEPGSLLLFKNKIDGTLWLYRTTQ